MSIFDDLKNLLQLSSHNRITDENKKIARPKVRPITYQGDRNTQELGNDIIENGVPLNNASKAIGDQMMPLAKGNVLKRIDNVNVSPAFGSALRDGLEKDNASGDKLGKNGGLPSAPNSPLRGTPAGSGGKKKFPTVPPPEGCYSVSPQCLWSPSSTPPAGYQSYGSVDTGSDKFGTVYLYCKGIVPPEDLGCNFLKKKKWKCIGGICIENDGGIYNSQAECESSRSVYYNVTLQGTAITGTGTVIPLYQESRGTTTDPNSVSVVRGSVAASVGGVTYYQYEANGITTTSGFLPTPTLIFSPVYSCAP